MRGSLLTQYTVVTYDEEHGGAVAMLLLVMVAVRRQLLEAIEIQFLHRLLRTSTPDRCQLSSFQVVAITIIACLCQDRSLLPQCRRLLSDVVEVLVLAEVRVAFCGSVSVQA